MSDGAVVLLSGGQDSTTCLAWALNKWDADDVYTISIDYGQRHRVELTHAAIVAEKLGVRTPHQVLNIEALAQLGAAALTNPDVRVDVNAAASGNKFAEEHDLPSTFVPGRNVLFITLALAYGAQRGIYNVVTGVCETDRAGYPDCREEFTESLEGTLELALDDPRVALWTPLIAISKADTFALADELDVLDIVLEYSHTCYHGNRKQRYDWGYGCGACGACHERRDGWEEYRRRVRDRAGV